MKPYCILLLLMISAACAQNGAVPSDVLPQEKMQDLVWDVMVADEYANELAMTDTTGNKNLKKERSLVYRQVFDLHQTSREEFNRSFNYYASHPDLSKVLFDTLSQRANRKRQEAFRMRLPKLP